MMPAPLITDYFRHAYYASADFEVAATTLLSLPR